jgi:hypothetical protein
LARTLTPRSIFSRASVENWTCLAAIWLLLSCGFYEEIRSPRA